MVLLKEKLIEIASSKDEINCVEEYYDSINLELINNNKIYTKGSNNT